MNTDENSVVEQQPLDAGILDITHRIIGCAHTVSNVLGSGFLEKVYENALVLEFRANGLGSEPQKAIPIRYRGLLVGEYVADVLVEGAVLVEIKAVRELDQVHVAQCVNYLRATGLKICLLINFGKPRVEVKRVLA